MHGEVSETQIAGFLIALRTKGETVDELAGLARTMRALAARVPSAREDLLDTAGHRRRATHVQRVDDGRADRGGRWLRGRQARQSLGHQRVGLGRPAGGARSANRSRPGWSGAMHRGGRVRIHVRAGAPSGDAVRDPGPARAGGTHDLQPARSAHQPGRGPSPADRRLRRRLPGDDRRGACAARRRSRARRRGARTASTRSRSRPPPKWSRSTARSSRATRSRRRTSESSRSHRELFERECAGGTPEQNAGVTRAILSGEGEGRWSVSRHRAGRDQRRRRDLRRRRGGLDRRGRAGGAGGAGGWRRRRGARALRARQP